MVAQAVQSALSQDHIAAFLTPRITDGLGCIEQAVATATNAIAVSSTFAVTMPPLLVSFKISRTFKDKFPPPPPPPFASQRVIAVSLSTSQYILVALLFAPRLLIKFKPFTFIAVLSVLPLINLPHPGPDLSNTVGWFQYSRLRGTYQSNLSQSSRLAIFS